MESEKPKSKKSKRKRIIVYSEVKGSNVPLNRELTIPTDGVELQEDDNFREFNSPED